MSSELLWSVYQCACEDPKDATCGLTKSQVMQLIYRYDGQDYSLEPKIIQVLDEETEEETGIEQQLQDSYGNFCWLLRFKKRGQWSRAERIWLKNDEYRPYAAELEWLESCFDNHAYDESKWSVREDEDHKQDVLEWARQKFEDNL